MKGLRYRNYHCVVNESSKVYIDNTKCDGLTKPKAVKVCYKTEGCTPQWAPLPWTEVILYLYCSITLVIYIIVVYQIL